MSMMQWIGMVGFWLIEFSYVSQIRKLYIVKEAEEFDLMFPILNVLGRVLALIYSILKKDFVLINGFILGIALRLTLMSQVIWYRYQHRRKKRLQDEAISI